MYLIFIVQYKFTFQYGQIRNKLLVSAFNVKSIIYIPVWLDQKPFQYRHIRNSVSYLHSSMVRLETNRGGTCYSNSYDLHSSMVRLETLKNVFNFYSLVQIYIPVWLDQKPDTLFQFNLSNPHLHSSMVRLETVL